MPSDFCPQCATPRTGSFRYCRSCKFDYDGGGIGTIPSTPTTAASTAKASKSPAERLLVGLIALALVAGGFLLWSKIQVDTIMNDVGSELASLRPSLGPGWAPAGFKVTTNPNVAIRWMEPAEIPTGSSWGLIAVTRLGCSTLYVELSILDSTGAAIGYTNDVLTGILPGQDAKLTFSDYTTGAAKARISDVSCY